MRQIEEQLLKELETFTAFARRRVGDPHLAADVVQDSLLKAVKSANQLRDDQSVTAWFYRILRRTIIDLYRRRASNQAALDRLEQELAAPPAAEEKQVACACVAALIPTLKSEYAELVRRLDLGAESVESVAATLGVSTNHLRVRHHRARRQLRARLEQTCQMCAKHGCLNCTCND